MTLPDQPGGTSLDFDLLGDLFGVSGTGEIPFLSDLTQPFVEGFLKQREIKESPGWLSASSSLFSGLIPGVAFVPNLLMTLANSILGLPFSIWPGTGPGGFIGEIPNILSDIGNFFFNLTGFFGGGVDFNDILFDIPEAIFNFVDTMILPTDLLASLIGGFIPGFQIPGLDASKIISGTFPLEMISGLLDVGGKVLTSLLSVPTSVITGLFSGGSILTSWIPGLDASKIVSGSFPMSMITGLLDALSETVQGLVDEFFGTAGLPISTFTNFLKSLGGLFPALTPTGGGIATANPLAGAVDLLNGTATIAQSGVGSVLQVVGGVATTAQHALSGFLGIFGIHQGTMNAITSGLTGSQGTAATASVNDVQLAAQNTAAALASNTSQILALQQGTSPSTAIALVDFSTYPDAGSLAAANFNQSYSGPLTSSILGIYGGVGYWNVGDTPSPNQYRDCIAVKNDVVTTGDDQLVGVSYSTAPESKTYDYILGRANLSGDTYILAWFDAGRVHLSCVVAGVTTNFTSAAYTKKPTAAYYLKCGPGRQFHIYENSVEILGYTEAGTTSAMGASYRRAGFGSRSNTAVFYWVPFALRPSKVTAFSLADA